VASYIFKILTEDDSFGNPGSLHRLGTLAKTMHDTAQKKVSELLSCKKEEFYFTSCGTEAINTALFGYMRANPRMGKHIISTRSEHKASLEVLQALEKEGYEVTYLPIDRKGQISWAQLSEAIRKDTALITLTHVNNETGAVLPIEQLVQIKNKMNPMTRIHLDCVQSLGKLPISLSAVGIDMASFSGHKIHCVKGIGGLFVKNGCRIEPLLYGGGQQNGIRSGTESPWLYGAFSLALEKAEERREKAYENAASLRYLLLEGLLPFSIHLNSPEEGLPFIVNVSFLDFQSETMLHALESLDVFVSTMSACASRKQKISYVLSEMGIKKEIASRAVRISFSSFSSREEVVSFCKAVSEVHNKFSLK